MPVKLFCKTGFHKSDQAVDSLLLVGTIGDDVDLRAADNAKGQDAEKALCVDAALFLFKNVAGLAWRPT